MRLGGPLFKDCSTPELWISALRERGYGASFCPLESAKDNRLVQAYADAAKKADVVIAEVGAWSNPLSPDDETRKTALRRCEEALDLAEKIGARCCVNISGSRSAQWNGPDPGNLTQETFDLIVETVRRIIDAVKPKRTFYTLETMPWMYPDSTESYVRLIKTIDRKGFAVHFDPVNLISSPQRFYNTGALISEFVAKLGRYIKSCHAKDISLSGKLTVRLDEVRPGSGGLDYRVYLKELDKLDADTSLMIEHLPTKEEYELAADYIRKVAKETGARIR